MHSNRYKIEGRNWNILHNGDFSGDVKFRVETYHPRIPNYAEENRVVFVDNSVERTRISALIHDPIEDVPADGYQVSLPYTLLEQIVADKIRNDLIDTLEQMEQEDLIRLLARRL